MNPREWVRQPESDQRTQKILRRSATLTEAALPQTCGRPRAGRTTRVIFRAYGVALPSCISRHGLWWSAGSANSSSICHGLKPQRRPGMQYCPREPWNHKGTAMATSMKRRNRIRDLIARLLDRQSGNTAPGRLYGHGPSGMNQQPRVEWSDNSAAVVGSPQNIQEKVAAYQAHGWGQQETGRSARQPEPVSSSGAIANPEPRNTRTLPPSLRSSWSTWADKWQR